MNILAQVVAVDVGGTTIKGGLMDRSGNFVSIRRSPTGREQGPEAVVSNILSFIAALWAEAPSRPAAIGLAVPGLVDSAAGVALRSSNLRWDGVPFSAMLRERYGVPVYLGHDTRSAGVAEFEEGAAKGSRHFLYITLGTGVGAALFMDGKPYIGHDGAGGELGHMQVDPSGERCPCGRIGCLEALASASAVIRRYGARSGDPVEAAETVLKRAEAGDAAAQQVWSDAVRALSFALSNYAILLSPERIILGGGLAEAGEALFDPISRHLRAYTMSPEPPQLLKGRFGPDAGVVGAGFCGWAAAEGRPY